jgi:hypothetical protein
LHIRFFDAAGGLSTRRFQKADLDKSEMREASIKMYDKHGMILRIETTANESPPPHSDSVK